MTISFACPHCITRFKVPESFGGKKARCKKCGHVMKVPVLPPPAASVATSGMFRLGAVQPEQLKPAHEATKVSPPGKMPSVGKTSLRLAPVSFNALKPDADDRPNCGKTRIPLNMSWKNRLTNQQLQSCRANLPHRLAACYGDGVGSPKKC